MEPRGWADPARLAVAVILLVVERLSIALAYVLCYRVGGCVIREGVVMGVDLHKAGLIDGTSHGMGH